MTDVQPTSVGLIAPVAAAQQEAPDVQLRLEGANTYYGRIHALQGVDLEVRRGEIVTLLGANGAGKTTTLKTISGLLHPKMGTVTFEGRDISNTPAHELVPAGIGHAPEGRRFFSRLTVLENLQMGGFTRTAAERDEDIEKALVLFPRLRERLMQKGGSLSGGEQQMLAIGRALMSRPRLLLLDEPSLGLSPILVQQIFSLITEINRQGITILLVEQNAMQALAIAHRGYVLQTGKVILADTAAGLAANEDVRKAYLGENCSRTAFGRTASARGGQVSRNRRRNWRVASCSGASRTCSGGPCSTTTPPSRNMTRSAASRANCHLVGDHDHRRAFVGNCFHDREDLADKLRVERARRLIEQEHLGVHGQGTRDGHPLLLTARQARWVLIPLVEHLDLVQVSLRGLDGLRLWARP